MAFEFNYEVIKKIGILDSGTDSPKELRLISWNGGKPKYDIRSWYQDDEGNERMTKGITLDKEELMSLRELITELLESGDDQSDTE